MKKMVGLRLMCAASLVAGFCTTSDAVVSPFYQFTKIAGRDSTFSTFGNNPSINDAGTVAFTTILANGSTYAIYTGNGVSTQPIYTAASGHSVQNGPTINNSGWVAFGAYNGSNGVYVSNGASTQFVGSGIVTTPSINNARKVAIDVNTGPGVENIAIWNNGTTSFVPTGGINFISVSEPVLNENDTVVFLGQIANVSGSALYRGTTSGMTRIIGNGDVIRAGFTVTSVGNRPTIDDNGRVVTWIEDSGGVRGLYYFNPDGTRQTIATSTGAFNQFATVYGSRPAIDLTGGMVFAAVLDDGRTGLFRGPDPVNDKIIATGDTLFGRTVYDIAFGPASINSSGQLAMQILFNDGGGNLIVRAQTVPEPVSIGVLAFAGGLLLRRDRRRR